MKVDWLQIKNQTEDTPSLYFYGDIVSSWWGAWEDEDQYPENVRNILDGVKGKDLNIYINSGGGSVFAGMAIYNMIKRHEGYKTVHIDGLGGSIASVIAFAGDKLIVPSNAYLMIHKPWNGTYGNANDFRKMADDLDAIEEGIINVYKDNLKEGVDIEEIREMVQNETWLNGLKASEYFNIEVVAENTAVACTSNLFNEYKNTPKAFKEPKNESPRNAEQEKINKLLREIDLI
ncbi:MULTISPECIES: head maturation protease, ClpP-related [Bacillales]|uniref:head maturation protease, ClpP-related n=1 Tax=Bacillales TaxID=1385 RepID=UPI0002385AA1|nr:peptidase [Bacillus cereus]BAL19575.1 clpP family serine protease, probable phage related [Bacillus cereus NC7401]